MKEIWKPIEGYENSYEISNLGRIKSLPHFRKGRYPNQFRHFKERILIDNQVTKQGYVHAQLWKNGKKRTYRRSRLVLKTFNPINNCDKLLADHINGDRTDDRLENLRWVTGQENMANHKYARYLQQLLEENNIEYKQPTEWSQNHYTSYSNSLRKEV